ncbi:MAG: hypothetical protein MZW92_19900 [Comamonadaceae bacterium]|nr:hypothetical protein [Comamonadaceae bacterium]
MFEIAGIVGQHWPTDRSDHFSTQQETSLSLKLFYAPGACSFVPHAMLELAGATFEPSTVKLHKG